MRQPASKIPGTRLAFPILASGLHLCEPSGRNHRLRRRWVLPGGRCDAEDASPACTALRELEEETGLQCSLGQCESPSLAWESCYPTTFDGWREARRSGGRAAHILVTFVVVRLAIDAAELPPLRLSAGECDCACWVPLEDLHLLGDGGAAPAGVLAGTEYARANVVGAEGGEASVPAALLSGVYPNTAGEGIGRGHVWALREFARLSRSM
jgi:8-oxo-dGTP pyrophosphatase MutT (NUDIX family)